jgi:LmbE family N-acetylglucosaminyl deacetylase
VTNGAGSPRDDLYAGHTDEQMQKVRRVEQKKAAYVGEYAAQVLLDFTSKEVKAPGNREVIDGIAKIVAASNAEVVYTHNLADKHDTHVGLALKVIQALREVPEARRPKKVFGCEVWRDLDWMMDTDKVVLDASAHPNIASALVGVFDSQICGGKRYDLATAGRRVAHATYFASHGTDQTTALNFAMDLTPLVDDPSLDVAAYVAGYIDRFRADVSERLAKMG